MCNNEASRKALFITWLAIHDRLATKARLCQWGVIADSSCIFCGHTVETIHHLFFECPVSKTLWTKCLQQLGINYTSRSFEDEVNLVAIRCRSKKP